MAQQVKRTVKKKKRKLSTANIILIVGCILIIVPCLIFGWILLSASLEGGSPILGARYSGDLDPAITNSQISSIESSVKNIPGVDKCTVELKTATLRVYADINDTADEATARSIADNVYGVVGSVLNPGTYFTKTDAQKMYDLEIHVYNLASKRDSDAFVYVIETKTSNMETPITQLVSEPIDAALAQQLRDNVEARNNPTPTPAVGDLTVGGEETEPVGSEDTASEEEPTATPEG